MLNRRLTLASLALLVSTSLNAQEATPDPVEPPFTPKSIQEDLNSLEPEVTIIQGTDQTIEEYRIEGRLYAIKVIPNNAPAYYLIDTTGEGQFTTVDAIDDRHSLKIPSWVIYEW